MLRTGAEFWFSDDKASSQTGADVDWTGYLKKLLPININHFAVVNGTVHLMSLVTQPPADLTLRRLQGEIRNIRNVVDVQNKLLSPVVASGDVDGYGGNMVFMANMNLLKELPDFRYRLRFNDIQMNKLNEHEHRTVGKFFAELLAQAATGLLKNHKKDQVATTIPITGTIDNVQTAFWPTLLGVLRNGYVEAFKKDFNPNMSLKDTFKEVRQKIKAKHQERKAERQKK